jgi:plastocyanin
MLDLFTLGVRIRFIEPHVTRAGDKMARSRVYTLEDIMHKRKAISAAVAAIGGLAAGASALYAGGDLVAYPEGFDKGVLYATIDRYDVKQFRELYASKAAVDAVRKGQPIPSGTVLTLVPYKAKVDDKGVPVKGPDGRFVKDGGPLSFNVMEKRQGWGAEYAPSLRNGEWEYQSFTTDKKANPKANLKACFECHKPHENLDFVMSLARLSGTALGSAKRPTGLGTVAIAEFLFGPETVKVQAGQKITWTNVDDSPHQVTVMASSTLRTPVLLKGQSTSIQFNDAGAYDYICGLHPGMKGKIEVAK